jgi:membrane-associated protein
MELIRAVGLIGIFAIIFAETGLLVGFFLPGDSLLFSAGFLARQGIFHPDPLTGLILLVTGCFIAAVVGDGVGYWFGHKWGRRLFDRQESLFFRKKNLIAAEEYFRKYGGITVVLARFLPFLRTFVPVVAGIGSMRYPHFLFFNVFGAILWAIGLPVLGYTLGGFIPKDEAERYIILITLAFFLIPGLPTAIHIVREYGPMALARLRGQKGAPSAE